MSKRVPIYNPESFMQGDTWTMTVDVQDNNGAPVNLTGYTATYELRERAGSASLLKLTVGSGITITPASGRVALAITATQSAALTFNRAKVQLKIISGGGVVQTLFYGDQEVISRIAV